jgi:hypothetical protein
MDMLALAAQGFAIWVAAQYVVGPLAVKMSNHAPERYSLPVAEWATIVASDTPGLAKRHEQLIVLGFLPVTATSLPNIAAIFYVHPVDGACAQLRDSKKFASVSFVQEFRDGKRLFVGNSPIPSIYPPWPRMISFNLSRAHEPTELFAKFKRIRTGCGGEPISASTESLLKAEEEFENAQLSYLIERGFYSSVVADGKRTISFKAALRSAWRLAWPSRPILVLSANARAERAAA